MNTKLLILPFCRWQNIATIRCARHDPAGIPLQGKFKRAAQVDSFQIGWGNAAQIFRRSGQDWQDRFVAGNYDHNCNTHWYIFPFRKTIVSSAPCLCGTHIPGPVTNLKVMSDKFALIPSHFPLVSASQVETSEAPTVTVLQPQSQSGLHQLPVEIQQSFLAFVGLRDRANWLKVSKWDRWVALPLVIAEMIDAAKAVSDHASFQMVLGQIKKLPDYLQLTPLLLLAARIVVLPPWVQEGGKRELLDAIDQLPPKIRTKSDEREQQERSERLTVQAEGIEDLTAFQKLLGSKIDKGEQDSIRSLRPDLQIRPLLALASRIVLFPQTDHDSAFASFHDACEEIPKEFEKNLPPVTRPKNRLYNIAVCEVLGGASVIATAEKYGIDESRLARISVNGPARADVEAGASVAATAEKYGIRSNDDIWRLEFTSLCGPAGADIEAGASVTATAEKYGIRLESLINMLADEPAEADVEAEHMT